MAIQYILDTNVILRDEPLGWHDSLLQITRDSAWKGIYAKYITTLTFVGDGYDYLMGVVDGGGMCSVVTVEINDDDPNAFSFKGQIFIDNINIDVNNCQIEALIEDDSFAQTVLRLKSTKIDCSTTSTIGGNALATVEEIIDLSQLSTPILGSTLSYSARGNTNGYRIFNLIQYLLNYVSNNSVTLISTFLNTDFLMEKQKFTFGGSINVGDVISYSYVNMWGDTITSAVPSLDPTITDFVSLLAGEMVIKYTNMTETIQAYNGDLLPFVWYDGYDLYVNYYVPFTLSFSATGATTVTATTVQSYQYGGGDLYLSSGNNLTQPTGLMITSLDDVISNLNKLFNLIIVFYVENGVQYCRIEQAKYFFGTTTSVAIDAFTTMKRSFVTDLGLTGVDYTHPENETYTLGLQSVASYATQSCYDRVQNSNSSWFIGMGNLLSNFYIDLQKLDMVLYQSNGSVLNNDAVLFDDHHQHITVLPVTAMAAMHYYVAKNHGYFGASSFKFGDRTVTIDDAIQIRNIYKFTGYLSCSQINDLMDAKNGKVKFTDINGTYLEGWIKEAKYSKTGLLEISLYTE